MTTARGRSERDRVPGLCGFYGIIEAIDAQASERELQLVAEQEATRRAGDMQLVGAALAIRMPFGFEARAEGIPSWLAFLGTMMIAGACFALYCVL